MDCRNCELKKRQFICENCLRIHLQDLRLKTQAHGKERDDQVNRATAALTNISASRLRRANVSTVQNSIEEIMGGLAKLRKDNDKSKERLQSLRETLATRRRTLAAAKLLPVVTTSHARELQELNNMSSTISRARSGLVQELVEVFNVVEVGGRPPIGGKAGTKGEWTIGDLILPVPGDIRRYPPDHINAVLTHTIHFLSLLTFYLGIKLPFEISWTGKKLGLGQPWIGASKGGETGGWAKWSTKHPLHLSSSSQPASPTTQAADERLSSTITNMSDSVVEPNPPPQSSFATALAMLIYNVTYLAYTQSVDIPLNQAGNVLSNLWSVCCSMELGKRSHLTQPLIPPPTPASFALDFAQLLQATTANPTSRARITRNRQTSTGSTAGKVDKQRRRLEDVEEDGWDMVEDESFGSSL
ncbi:UV radiation resistance protein and autophagy-related subunit 14-domain-containing protein [Mycena floridula]|nr:UV radiation resistance protein and autophagy-related subunit 14-domain-containing protein [Mycena floridula]